MPCISLWLLHENCIMGICLHCVASIVHVVIHCGHIRPDLHCYTLTSYFSVYNIAMLAGNIGVLVLCAVFLTIFFQLSVRDSLIKK